MKRNGVLRFFLRRFCCEIFFSVGWRSAGWIWESPNPLHGLPEMRRLPCDGTICPRGPGGPHDARLQQRSFRDVPPPHRRPCSATNRRNAQYLDFLCVLCLCEGAPITRNQDVICQQLLKKKAHVLLPMQRQQGQVCGPRPLLGRESRIGNQAFFLHHPNSTAKVNSTVKGLCPPSSFINRLSQPPAQSLDQPIGCGDGVCVWVAVMCWPKVG